MKTRSRSVSLKKIFLYSILVVGLSILLPSTVAAIEITVDAGTVDHEISPYILGVNHRTGNSGYRTFERSYDGELNPGVVNASKYGGITNVRWAGGCIADSVRWEEAIGAWKTRNPQISPFAEMADYSGSYGIPEHMAFCEALGSDGTAILVLPFSMCASAQDAADFVEYMNTPVGQNPNGGIAWADKRADDGHPEPYNVKYWEIGNEAGGSWAFRWTDEAAKYAQGGQETYTPGSKYGKAVKYYDFSKHKSDGTANQIWYTIFDPVNTGSVTVKVGGTTWTEVDSLAGMGAGNYYEFDYPVGKITFGDGVDGNIPAEGAAIDVGYTVTKSGANDFAAAMKAVDSTIHVAACWGGDYLSSDIDCFVKHPYKYEDETTTDAEDFHYDLMSKAVLEFTTEYGREVVLSEWGVMDQNFSAPAAYEGHGLKSLTMALFNSKSLFDLIEDGNVNYAGRHMLNTSASDDTRNTSYAPDNGVIAPVEEGVYVNGTLLPFKLFRERLSNKNVPVTVSGSPVVGGVNIIEAVAAKNAAGDVLDLIVNNVHTTNDYEVTITLSSFIPFSQATVWTLNGPKFTSYNASANPHNVKVIGGTISNASSSFTYAFPAHSVTAIRFDLDDGQQPDPVFPDIAPYPVKNFDDTFDNDTVGEKGPSWVGGGGNGTALVTEIPSATDQSIEIHDTSSSGYVEISRTFTPETATFTFETVLMLPVNTKSFYFQLRDSDNNKGPTVWLHSDGSIYYRVGSTNYFVDNYSGNIWYTLKLVVDVVADTFDFYINGVLKASDCGFQNSLTSISKIAFDSDTSTANDYLYISKVKVTDTTPPTISEVSCSQSTKVKVTYDEAVDEASATTVSNYSIDNGITISSAAMDGTSAVILTTSAHSTGITYTLTVNNVKDTASNTIDPNTQATYSYAELTTHTYNFEGITQSNTDYNAYACDVDVFPFAGSSSNRNSMVEATDQEYTNISADNTAQWATVDPSARDEIFLWVEMKIEEAVGGISQIDLTFNGNTDGRSATTHKIYVMKKGADWTQDASWVQVGTSLDIEPDVDTEMTRSITSSITDYIDASGNIVWGVYETRSSEDMRINYLEMVVTY